MIKDLSIECFKSIRALSIPCRKVNVFIGPPDTGKTNILEALYFLSRLGHRLPLDASLRLRRELGFGPLFYRQFYDQPLRIVLRLARQADDTVDEVSLNATIGRPARHMVIQTMG